MKRLLCIVLLSALLLTACAPVSETPEDGEAFLFWFPAEMPADGKVFLTLAVGEETAQLPLSELLQAYFSAQPPLGAVSLPSVWYLRTAQLDAAVCTLTFSGRSVAPAERSLACGAIARTLLQLDGVQRVSLQVPGSDVPLVLTGGDILTQDTGMLPQEEQMTLYYPDGENRYLLRQTRTVQAADPAEKPADIVRALLSDGLLPSVPPQTALLDLSVEDGVCTVDLSADFTEASYSFAEERLTLYALVNSLTELPQIRTVDLWVAGAPLERLHLLELSDGLTRDESLLFDATDSALTDQTIYAVCGSEALLVGIPMQFEPSETLSAPEQVMTALIDYEGANGIRNPVPTGTKLLSVRLEGSACIVDLTGEFLDGCADTADEQAAVRAVVATLCSLEGIDSAEILVEGLEPSYRSTHLRRVRQPAADWFAE